MVLKRRDASERISIYFEKFEQVSNAKHDLEKEGYSINYFNTFV